MVAFTLFKNLVNAPQRGKGTGYNVNFKWSSRLLGGAQAFKNDAQTTECNIACHVLTIWCVILH